MSRRRDEKTSDSTPDHQPNTLRQMANEERPRQRLLQFGPRVLSDAELLAVLLGNGSRGASALDLARDLMERAGSLRGLMDLDEDTARGPGMGDAKVAAFLSAVELATRLSYAQIPDHVSLERPRAVAKYLGMRYGALNQEVMGALYLTPRHRLIGERELFRGTIERAAVSPREILREGLRVGAGAVLIFHNHPSGSPAPTPEDLAFTRRCAEAAEIVGIVFKDHIIVGGDRWVSLRERGAW